MHGWWPASATSLKLALLIKSHLKNMSFLYYCQLWCSEVGRKRDLRYLSHAKQHLLAEKIGGANVWGGGIPNKTVLCISGRVHSLRKEPRRRVRNERVK